MEACKRCGKMFEPEHRGPVTASGWYGSYDIRWEAGRMVRFGPYCDPCKVREQDPHN